MNFNQIEKFTGLSNNGDAVFTHDSKASTISGDALLARKAALKTINAPSYTQPLIAQFDEALAAIALYKKHDKTKENEMEVLNLIGKGEDALFRSDRGGIDCPDVCNQSYADLKRSMARQQPEVLPKHWPRGLRA